MAYSPLPTKASQDYFTLGNYNAVKHNFEAGVPDVFTAKGDLAVGVGPNAAAPLAVGSNNSVIISDEFETTGMAWQIIPGARVYNSANIDPNPSSWTPLSLDSERTDAEAMHSATAAYRRLVVPSGGDGLYLIGGSVTFDTSGASSGGSIKGLRIVLNSTIIIAERLIGVVHGSLDYALSLCTLYELAAADYVELVAYTSTDVDIVASGNSSPEFWAVWQRRSRRYL